MTRHDCEYRIFIEALRHFLGLPPLYEDDNAKTVAERFDCPTYEAPGYTMRRNKYPPCP